MWLQTSLTLCPLSAPWSPSCSTPVCVTNCPKNKKNVCECCANRPELQKAWLVGLNDLCETPRFALAKCEPSKLDRPFPTDPFHTGEKTHVGGCISPLDLNCLFLYQVLDAPTLLGELIEAFSLLLRRS